MGFGVECQTGGISRKKVFFSLCLVTLVDPQKVGFLHLRKRFIESMGIVPKSYDEGAYCELPL